MTAEIQELQAIHMSVQTAELNIIGFSFTTGVLIKIFVRFSSILSTTVLFFINILINDKE